MTPERHARIGRLFDEAVALAPELRLDFLKQACTGDSSLLEQVRSLLASHEQASGFMVSPAWEVAARELAQTPAAAARLPRGSTLGQYEIMSFIGAGGMGDVYIAQAAQLNRKIALKVLRNDLMADGDRVRRFQQEARAVSALNHPNILTIHEIGQAENCHFIACELIEGQTLRRHMQEPLKLAEVLDVSTQIAGALVAAHAAGVIHRDIKPENIMIRPDGYAKILDFGLAKLTEGAEAVAGSQVPTAERFSTATGVVMGTCSYMSPEQARGLKVDARSDIFSLGVVLYEMVAGRRPFEGETTSDVVAAILLKEPPPMARYAAIDIPAELQRIVAKTLCKSPDERYQSIKDLWLDLKSLKQTVESTARQEPVQLDMSTAAAKPPLQHKKSWSRLRIGLVAALVLLVAAGAWMRFGRQPVLADKETVLLADFANTTGDSVFDGSLKQALFVQLQQTPFLNLFPDEEVGATLTTMTLSPDSHVTRQVGIEICRRRGLKAMIIGTIASLGRNYIITLEAIDSQTSATIASHQIEVESKERVIRGLGEAAKELRRKLGESIKSLKTYDKPVLLATTGSLEALKALSAGLDGLVAGRYLDAKPFFIRAVELDENFAEAYELLSWAEGNMGNLKAAADAATKAYALRDRATEWERLYIGSTYHYWVTGDWEKQLESSAQILASYPKDWSPLMDYTIDYFQLGQYEKVVQFAPRALQINPSIRFAYTALETSLVNLNRLDEARKVSQQALARGIESPNLPALIDLVQGATSATPANLAFRGRLKEADMLLKQGIATPLGWVRRKALLGFCDKNAAGAMNPEMPVFPTRLIIPPVLPDGSLCPNIDIEKAQRLVDKLRDTYPQSTPHKRLSLPFIQAAIHLRLRQFDLALDALKPNVNYDGGSLGAGYPPGLGSYLRGQAYLGKGLNAEAAREFQRILDHPGWKQYQSPIHPLAYLGAARAYGRADDTEASRKAYDQLLLNLWKDADADLQIVMDAQKEYQQLN